MRTYRLRGTAVRLDRCGGSADRSDPGLREHVRAETGRADRRPGHADPGTAAGSAPGLRSAWRFWATAYTLLVLLTGTNLPTPLYRGYARQFGFSPLVVTFIFAAYVAVLIPALLVAGPLSDAIGRRRVLLPAVLVAALGSLGFALATDTAWLFAARMLQGAALGAASGPLTAALSDLEPTGNRRRAALVSTMASVGGIGCGPLLAGFLAQYLPAPHVVPFAVEIALLLPAAAVILALPQTGSTTRWRPRRPGIPKSVRAIFVTSGTASFLAFAVVGLFLTMIPTYVAALSGSTNLLTAGTAVALMLICSALAQLAGYGRPPHTLELAGLPLLAVGLALLAVAGSVSSLTLLLTATVIAGIGQGLVFLGGLTTVNQAAPADRHADVLSSFYVVCYLGTGVPVIGVGFLATAFGLLTAVRFFATAVVIGCATVLTLLTVRRRRPNPHGE